MRIRRACYLLLNSELSIEKIAAESGFNNRQNFAYMFKRMMNVTLVNTAPMKPTTICGFSIHRNIPTKLKSEEKDEHSDDLRKHIHFGTSSNDAAFFADRGSVRPLCLPAVFDTVGRGSTLPARWSIWLYREKRPAVCMYTTTHASYALMSELKLEHLVQENLRLVATYVLPRAGLAVTVEAVPETAVLRVHTAAEKYRRRAWWISASCPALFAGFYVWAVCGMYSTRKESEVHYCRQTWHGRDSGKPLRLRKWGCIRAL